MFTTGALGLIAILALYTSWDNKRDRAQYDATTGEERLRILVLHARQDLALIANLLSGVIIMLGIIADRMH